MKDEQPIQRDDAEPALRRVKPRWHFGQPAVSIPVIVLSLVAAAVPVAATILGAVDPARFEALLWMAVLVPGFLLAYHRGWVGVATGLAAGMALFSVAQVYLISSGQRLPDWPFILSITAALVLLSVLVGEVTNRLHTERERAERLALFDPLTGLPNRRYFEMIAEREVAAARRGRGLTFVAFDLDGLKQVNDAHGHPAGDEVLREFGRVLDHNTRTMDLSARLGGDEFVSILSSSTVEGAMVFVRRVQDAVRALDLPWGRVSVCAGLAAFHGDMADTAALTAAADAALYEAKRRPGSVAVWGPDEASAPGRGPSAVHAGGQMAHLRRPEVA